MTQNEIKIMKKFFRFHRGLFTESMATRVEINGLPDIIRLVNPPDDALFKDFFKNVHIDKDGVKDERCLVYDGWGDTSYYVLADFNEYKNQCIGMCNFYEDD